MSALCPWVSAGAGCMPPRNLLCALVDPSTDAGLIPPYPVQFQCDAARFALSRWAKGGGVGTRPWYLIVCLWRCLLASRHCSF